MNLEEALRALSLARQYAIMRAPYFSTALRSLIPYYVEGFKTLGVTKTGIMYFGFEPLEKWSPQQLAAVLVHEAQHLLRNHSTRGEGLDHERWNMAGDCEINDDLRLSWQLPTEGLQPSKFGMPDGLLAEEYYALLPKQPGKQPQSCGGCAGNADPEQVTQAQASGEIRGHSNATLEGLRKSTANAVREHIKNRGTVSSDMSRWADTILEPPKVPWNKVLHRQLKKSVYAQSGKVDFRYTKISKKQGGIGYGFNRPIMPGMVQPVLNCIIAIDTSGSIDDKQLQLAMAEVKSIIAAVGGTVTTISCDAVIQSVTTSRSTQRIAKTLKGGGGTDFVPVFEYANKQRKRTNIVVYITDAIGTAPDTKPAGYDTIWCVFGDRTPFNSQCKEISWGTFVRINNT